MNVCAILCLLVCLGFSAVGHAAVAATNDADFLALRTTGPRTSGPVSVSLQNEINAAVDRGRDWLLAQQNADGSWGAPAGLRTRTTALAVLALLQNPTPAQRQAAVRGSRWLAQAPSPEIPDAPAEHAAWRSLSLRLVADPSVASVATCTAAGNATNQVLTPMHAMLLHELGRFPATAPIPSPASLHPDLPEACLWALLPTAAPSAAADLLTQAANQWSGAMTGFSTPSAQDRTRWAWILARFINRAGSGTLADAQGHVLDWRNDLARELVATQTIDRQGHGGYWQRTPPPPAAAAETIEPTAFALLALNEL